MHALVRRMLFSSLNIPEFVCFIMVLGPPGTIALRNDADENFIACPQNADGNNDISWSEGTLAIIECQYIFIVLR